MKIQIDEVALHSLYMKEVNDICEECDWKTQFDPEEIVNIIARILEKNTFLISIEEK